MIRLTIIALALVLSGCAERGVISTTERSITIVSATTSADQQNGASQAERYCASRGLKARRAMESAVGELLRVTYDCVP